VQVLLAVIAGSYAVYHGPQGLRRIAERVHLMTAALAEGLARAGRPVRSTAFFDTLRVDLAPADLRKVRAAAEAKRIDLRAYEDGVGVSLDETTTERDLADVLAVIAGKPLIPAQVGAPGFGALARKTPILEHPVFNTHHSESEMMRYLAMLQSRDLSLTTSMIPLGSCTMKLNAAAEMLPITFPGFSKIHPFAPVSETKGYQQLFRDLERWLAEITGFAACSLQPNAGSQGEYAGLLVVRAYHESRAQGHRDVCLIPSSAHGTNAASAVLAGMRVLVVACDDEGNVDLADLADKAQANADRLAAVMITYPSTHGVFEEGVVEMCEIVHAHGGQVYVDGANLNALVGYAQPGSFGGDVSHLNLHKTFCIPHGGGGPGVGPVAVRAHLAPFLPTHPLRADAGPAEAVVGPVAAAPFGSAGILPISWAYIAMMGAGGLRRATGVAILSANYVAKRVGPAFPVLYTGPAGLVAHECILDLRPVTSETGITAEDVAKRLIDYGFHAPTMSFPVAGTLMVEPTESEDLAELDRFCDAMIAIRREIAQVASGEYDARDNPLKNAPHTASMLLAADWKHPYQRADAAYPAPGDRRAKYWPPVRRIDQAYGDRHLACACPPPEAFAD
jgi:glycine dehydrogenase